MVPHILGSFREYLDTSTSWDLIRDHTELFVCFGGIPLKNGQISQGGTGRHYQREKLIAAAAENIDFVNISPIRADLLESVGGEWLALRPNTDTALLLGVAHTLHTEGLSDPAFLNRYTEGFDEFLPYLLGQSDGIPKSAAWAADICELNEDDILSLARRMAHKRTMISVSWSLTRQDHGEQAFWAAITVAAMLGQIGLPGGGFGFGYSAMNYIGGDFAILPYSALPQGKNPVRDFIPVARITDLLTRAGETVEFDGQTLTYPEIKMMYWAGGNPFHHHQDLGRLMEAWQKPDTVIVHEWCWNSLAKRGDIVLPCTTPLERQDIAMTPRDPYIVSMSKLTEPYAQSRNDYDIFAGIASELGISQAFTGGRSDAQWLRDIYEETRENVAHLGHDLPDYEKLLETGWHKLDDPSEPKIMLKDFRNDPVKNALSTPSGKIEIFSKTVSDFGYDDCPGHTVWREPYEWLGGSDQSHPFHLISNQPPAKLHSQIDHGSVSRASKVNGREALRIHPLDAQICGVKDGDLVRVYNDRGACLGTVVTDTSLRRNVVQMSTGSWFDPLDPSDPYSLCKHGNPNVLTRDKGTSKLGQGPSAHTCLVSVEPFSGIPPKVTAHEPPEIIRK